MPGRPIFGCERSCLWWPKRFIYIHLLLLYTYMFILLLGDFKFIEQFILRLKKFGSQLWSSPVKYSFPYLFRQFDEKLVFSGVYFGWACCQTDTKIQLGWSPRRCVTEICFSDPLITCLMQNNPSLQSDNQPKEDDGIRFYCRWNWDSLIKKVFVYFKVSWCSSEVYG